MSEQKKSRQYSLEEELPDTGIPVLQTVSLRKVLETFGESIVTLKAEGGNIVTDTTTLDDLYGVRVISSTGKGIQWDYKQKRELSGEPKNPLDINGINKALGYIESRLPAIETAGDEEVPPDIAVRKVVIEIIDEILAEKAAEVTPWYDGKRNKFLLTFINDPAERRTGDQAIPPIDVVFARNRGLKIHAQGFKGRVLNMRNMIETGRFYSADEEVRYIAQWGGPEDHFPKFPRVIGEHIYNNYLPDGFGELNYYYTDKQSILQLNGWKMR